MPRPIQATIHLQALQHNLNKVREFAPKSKVWAVLKANAYGHGLSRVWRALSSAEGLAVLDLNEATHLREAGWLGPILLLEGFFQYEDIAVIEHLQITTTVHNESQLEMLETFADQAKFKHPIAIQLKMNSGMNRLGFDPTSYQQAWQRASQCKAIGHINLMMHFSDADGPRGIDHQMRSFTEFAAELPGERSFSNSASILWHANAHADWVRPGIMLYGASPTGRFADIAQANLRAAMTLRSEIIAIQDLKVGDSVGYSSRFIADKAMRVGVVACGYADGYPRIAQSGTPVLVLDENVQGGQRCDLVGQVSMDMLVIDLSQIPQAKVGTKVELWGQLLPIDDVANGANTIGYELMCALAPRVPVVVEDLDNLNE